jgi:non-heme chloroperoxidase
VNPGFGGTEARRLSFQANARKLNEKGAPMALIKTRDGTQLYIKDWGAGEPVIFVHGWPLNADMWDYQLAHLGAHGLRCIAYDRRGFGRSDQPWMGYDYDTLADDLADVIDALDVASVSLVGFSMGGGEVARYIARHGGEKVRRAVLVAAVTPYLIKTAEHPDGVDVSVFDEMVEGLMKDRPHFLAQFGPKFFGKTLLDPKVSDEVLQWTLMMAMQGSLRATLACVRAFSETDFRPDLPKFSMPTLVIHGTADKTVPLDVAGRQAAKLVPHAQFIEYENEPHGLFLTAKDRLNADLLAFLRG